MTTPYAELEPEQKLLFQIVAKNIRLWRQAMWAVAVQAKALVAEVQTTGFYRNNFPSADEVITTDANQGSVSIFAGELKSADFNDASTEAAAVAEAVLVTNLAAYSKAIGADVAN